MLTVGVTTTVNPTIGPGVQVYDVPPVADKDVVPPLQMVGEVADGVIVGFGLTVIVVVFIVVHPVAFAPVTVYCVVIVGLTTTLLPDKAPGIQVKEVAVPEVVKVDDPAPQIKAGLRVTVKVGAVVTVIVATADDVQLPFAPINVYVVLVVGLNTATVVVMFPGNQV